MLILFCSDSLNTTLVNRVFGRLESEETLGTIQIPHPVQALLEAHLGVCKQ